MAKQVTFLKQNPPFNAGETVTFPDVVQDIAERLVSSGDATAVGFTPNAALGAQMVRAFKAGDAKAMDLNTKAGFQFSGS